MVQMKTIFAFYCFLSSFANQLVNSGLPVIRPVPCSNHLTGESGICTFNWSCVNVAHGVYIGPCVDRFFVGTCCKIPEGTEFNNTGSSDNAFIQTTRKSGQMATPTPPFHALATKTQTEKLKKPIPMINIHHFNVTLTPFDYSEYSAMPTPISYHHQPFQPEMKFDSEFPPVTNHWDYEPVSSPEKIPELSASFLYSLFFSNHNPPPMNGNSSNKKPKPTTPISTTLTTSTETTIHSQNTKPDLSHQNQPPTSSVHNQRVTVHPLFDMRIPITVHPSFDMRRPITLHPTFDMRKPVVVHETHDQRKPLFPDEAHDLRWPVLEEDSHDQRVPIVNYFNWVGNLFSNHNPIRLGYDSVKTAPTVETKLATSYPPTTNTKFTTQSKYGSPAYPEVGPVNAPVYKEQDTRTSPSTIASTAPAGFENADNTINTFSNFTLFVRPTSSRPSSSPPAPFGPLPTISTESIFRDVSQVCGRPRSGTTARIVGGRKSHYLRWPWMISLRRFEGRSYKHKCGAILLNQYWAATAAHCVDGQLPMDLTLRLGEYNLHRADEMHPHVERRVYVMVLHPHFDHVTYENDLALLRFYEPVPFQANIVPVCLPNVMDDLTGRIAVVTGWGRLSEEGELPASLHEVHMPILSNYECQQMYYEAGYAENIRDVFVCAGISHGGLDACEGDSGGPMVVRGDQGEWVLVGLISWGMGCAAPKQPGVYTRISHFTDWIQGIISH